MITVLGIAASLRNARFGRESEALCDDIRQLENAASVTEYIASKTRLSPDTVAEHVARDDMSFDAAYAILRRERLGQGLSNSEAALVAALWGAHDAGAEIAHCALAPFFPANGVSRRLDELRTALLAADAIVLSGPVYFGDRGSLAHEFIEFVRNDAECAAHLKGRVYGGVAVGAKRNGGQETTLVYQMLDFTAMGMLAVGNDFETTSQYGGTCVAGDVGTMSKDKYGIDTSIGTGRRVARVAAMLAAPVTHTPVRPVKIAVWVLQDDSQNQFRAHLDRLRSEIMAAVPHVDLVVHEFSTEAVYRCIACDLCPTRSGPRDEYRCIVTADADLFQRRHHEIIDADAILVAAYSPIDRQNIRSVYQRFIERTRYLRRDDYVFSDLLTAPLVIEQMSSEQNLALRMLTSMVRHHTIMHRPLIGMEVDGNVANWNHLVQQGISFAEYALRLVAARPAVQTRAETYNPVGYVISSAARAGTHAGA
ncbi:MAG TPA: NAD(P)H-dependent oxidoreductase [Gemmatimonadaceae bacterium]|jgi:multimeric flavodoxin WrbA